MSELTTAAEELSWEVKHNPNGPIARAVREAVAAADKFSREFAALGSMGGEPAEAAFVSPEPTNQETP